MPLPPACPAAVVDPSTRRLVAGEVPTPRPGEGEILLEVAAAGVNRLDLDLKEEGAMELLGLEAAGVVAAAGPGVRKFKPGDRVMALMRGGAYAGYAVARVELTLPVPERLDFARAAAVPEAYFTVWSNVFMDGGLAPGEVFLVHGGASGVGSAAIQIAKAMGAVVVTTASSPEKAGFCRRLGADVVVDYRTVDFQVETARLLGGRSVDVVLDWVGREYLDKHLALLGRRGRLVLIDSRSGDAASLDLGVLMRKNVVLTGSLLRPRPLDEKAAIAADIRARLLPKLESGELVPVVSHRIPLASAEEAHAVVARGEGLGKVVLLHR